MKTIGRSFLAGALAATVFTANLAVAQETVLYDNGAVGGREDAFPISGANRVANSFTLDHDSTVTSFTFGAWNSGKSRMTALDWVIVAKPSMVVDGRTAKVTSQFLFTDSQGYRVFADTVTIPPTRLKAGVYFLQLQRAQMTQGGTGYWDEVDGPSRAWEDGAYLRGRRGGWGHLCPRPHCSESFSIIGH